MSRTPKISDAEWEVMNVIWGKSPITANKVVEALAKHTGWSPKTIKTMLNRLVKKGALTYEAQGKAYLYRPRVSKDACVREESRSFTDRVFGGNPTPMLAHLVENTRLSPADIKRLRQILKDKEK
ncbi:MAG: BlaI/MecI/CopY family transcriptional regulator [Kiritimatiellae bacterium]|nr:BlaI/MecI/CopY family transcriptional regulator [Kiritimatiellia bacterium]